MIEQISHFLDQVGAAWVLYLLIGMSVVSVALVVERALFFRARRVPVVVLETKLLAALDLAEAEVEASPEDNTDDGDDSGEQSGQQDNSQDGEEIGRAHV